MRSIEISEETSKRLNRAVKSDETSELVIRRLLDRLEKAENLTQGTKPAREALTQRRVDVSQEISQQKFKTWKRQLKQQPGATPLPPSGDDNVQTFGPGNFPQSVTHTKIFEAKLNGRPVHAFALRWNPLIHQVLVIMNSKGQFSASDDYPDINIHPENKNDKGYTYVPEIDCSVQATDANAALRCITSLAQKHSLSVDLVFGWRDKKGALHPGKFGRILIDPQGR